MINLDSNIKLGNTVVLYDGVCGLCNGFIQFALKHDQKRLFMFASLQSDFAYRLLSKYGANPRDLNSIFVIADYGLTNERVLAKAKAAIFVISNLGGIYTLARLLDLLPTPFLDWGYQLVAVNRYKIFGKYETCLLPDASVQDRFIEV